MIIVMDQDLNVQVLLGNVNTLGTTIINQKEVIAIEEGEVSSDTSGTVSGDMSGTVSGDMSGDINSMTGTTTKDPLLSGWPFVIGISSLTLVVSIGLGILLAKRKIKKGFELYED